MLVLTRDDVEALLDLDALVDALADAFVDLSEGRASMPQRVAAFSGHGLLGTMPAYLPSSQILETKLVTLFEGNAGTDLPTHQAAIAVFDPERGAMTALMDGTYITATRTAAGSALSARLLAREDARVLAVCGTGVQAGTHARAVSRVRSFDEIRIAGRDRAKAAAVAAEVGGVAVDSFEEAVRGADVVSATTHAPDPVVRHEWLKPGAHVTSVGVNPDGAELEQKLVADAAVFVESRDAVLAPFPAGANDLRGIDPERLTELGEVLTGKQPGRTSAEQVTVYKSVGVGVMDAAAAALVMRAAAERGSGREIIEAIETKKKDPAPAIIDAKYSETAAPPPAETTSPAPAKQQDGKGESTFTIYGFAMLDAGYQLKQNHPDWFDVIRPTKLPSFPNEFAPNGKTYFGVRQSRLGVKSTTPTKYGELKTQFEFELFGTGVDAGQTTFRLRHAYGELGQFGAGQTWSPFMDIDVFPNSLEYWGPNGMVFFRNVQFRWMPLKGRNAVTIAVERPGASGDQGVFQDRIELQGIRGKFDLPDLSGNVRFTRDWGYLQVAGMLRRIKWVDTIDDAFDLGGTEVGAGLNITSNLKFTPKDTGRFAFVFGQGIQNYMNDAPVDVGIELTPGGDPRRPIKGVALPMWSMVAFLDHNWSKRFSTAAGYSFMDIDNSNGQAANAYHRGHYALTNLLFYPTDNVMIGGELQWGRRENFLDGFKSDDFRIQFSFKYNFSKTFTY